MLVGGGEWPHSVEMTYPSMIDLDRVLRSDAGLFDVVRVFSGAIEAKEIGTWAHTSRVAALAVAIARDLKLDEDRLRVLAFGALLHDVGKVNTPDAILLKPFPLTDEERMLIREHPMDGWQILNESPLLRDVATIARYHHERLDGSGYPEGLAGESIPFEARIVSVADVFDALTSDRPYRSAWSRERTLASIAEQRGKQLDPECVDALLRVVDYGLQAA
jgi:putative nucleotidyltransferase with HDIG domain